MSDLKEETKRQVRALLLSAPKGLTVLGIQNDFKSMLGKTLPFRELGYPTAEHLFRDLPDVVRVTSVGEEVVLRGISDRSTEHIERMVSRQKVSSKAKRRRYNGNDNVNGAPPGRGRLPRGGASRGGGGASRGGGSARGKGRGDRIFRNNNPYIAYLPPWTWPRPYRPAARYRAAIPPDDMWTTAATFSPRQAPALPYWNRPMPRFSPRARATLPTRRVWGDDAVDVFPQNNRCGVTQNNEDCVDDFGNYVGAQLSYLPDCEAKERLKLDIQRLLMNARVAEMVQPKPQWHRLPLIRKAQYYQ